MATIKDPVPVYWRSHARRPVLQIQWNGKGARRQPGNTNRRHAKQQANRIDFSRVLLFYRSLSMGEKITWENFSNTWTSTNKYGDTIVIGSWQWFSRFNVALLAVGLPMINVAPGTPMPTFNPNFSLIGAPINNPIYVSYSPVIPAGAGILVRRKIQVSKAISKAPLPLESYAQFQFGSANPHVIAGSTENVNAGRQNWFEFKPIDSFGRSPGSTILNIESS